MESDKFHREHYISSVQNEFERTHHGIYLDKRNNNKKNEEN